MVTYSIVFTLRIHYNPQTNPLVPLDADAANLLLLSNHQNLLHLLCCDSNIIYLRYIEGPSPPANSALVGEDKPALSLLSIGS